MIVRKIKPEEYKRTEELFSIAFCIPYDCDKTPMERYKEKMENPETGETVKSLDKYAAFEDDDKTMMSCLSATYFPIHFSGNKVMMTGIGDVSSLPAYRRRGGVRACFTKMLRDSYEAGVTFSYLYPFSTCFYNQFGYGIGIRGKAYELDLSQIPKYHTTGTCILAEPENAQELLKDVSAVYEVWQQKYNGMVINDSSEYQFLIDANPCKNQEFVYLYRSAGGTPKGYISFRREEQDAGKILSCTRIVFTDGEGLMGLLELAASYAADYGSIRFTVPEDVEIEAVLKEIVYGACRLSRSYMGMVRVVNVENALRLSSYRGEGSISIRINDPLIEANNGIFTIIYENGKAIEIHREPIAEDKKENHAINMRIDHFSEFIFQNHPASNFLYYGEQSLTKEEVSGLEKSFVRRSSYLMKGF